MCPDSELLSVFLDNELPSPWRDRMEEHLSTCEACRARLEALKGVATLMQEDAASTPVDEAMARVRERIDNSSWKAFAPKPASGLRLPDFSRFMRPINVPLPLAAATAALLVFMAFFALRPASRQEASQPRIAAHEETIPSMDIPAILRYLEARDSGEGIMVIQLPESSSFSRYGEPTFIRAADYQTGSRR